MTLEELQGRISRWEDLHTEFKAGPIHPDDLLVFGVTEERRTVGVDDPDGLMRSVDNAAAQSCEPPVTVVQEVLRPGGAASPVVVVNVPKGSMRPYRSNRGVYYVRTTTGRRRASREELLRLFQASESLYYDETPLLRLSLKDLDLAAFEDYLERTGQEDLFEEHERLLKNWSLLEDRHPTIAGVLLFGREPQRHLPYAQINAARFPGDDPSLDPSDRKDLRGRLLDVIDQAERFLDLHLRTPHRIRGFEPEPRPELPKAALREAVVNAVAHRDYTIHGPVRLFIFEDRIELHTPGTPPNGVDAEAMRAGVHVVRNPTLYARLSDAGLVTRAGTGIRRIIRLVREATGMDISIDVRAFEVCLTLPRNPTAAGPEE